MAIGELLLDPKIRAGQAYSLEEELKLKEEISNKLVGDRLEIALAAFPFKIQNPLKTISLKPDMGEKVVLERLKVIANIAAEIGVNIHYNIIADGCFYSDELFVKKAIAEEYLRYVINISSSIGLNATFVELENLVKSKNISVRPLEYSNESHKSFILRTAGMINTMEYESELSELYSNEKNIAKVMTILLEHDKSFKEMCEYSAAIYQMKKQVVEEQEIFKNYFSSSIRASIQVDTNRNLLTGAIDRPLAIRITESKGKNLFPWLGVGYFDGKEWSNIYSCEAKEKNLKFSISNGLMFYSK
ncbi:MAG: L-tyrosine/L-tryptophan isonitrile synthase family protein [Candidatus Nanoarchaeia archaeon]